MPVFIICIKISMKVWLWVHYGSLYVKIISLDCFQCEQYSTVVWSTGSTEAAGLETSQQLLGNWLLGKNVPWQPLPKRLGSGWRLLVVTRWNQLQRGCYTKNLLVIAFVVSRLLRLPIVSTCLQTVATYLLSESETRKSVTKNWIREYLPSQ